MFGDFKLHRSSGLALRDPRSRPHLVALHHVFDPQVDEIAAAQLAINGQIEERQVTHAVGNLKPDANGPNFAGLQRRLLARHPTFIPRHKWLVRLLESLRLHDCPPSLEDWNSDAYLC